MTTTRTQPTGHATAPRPRRRRLGVTGVIAVVLVLLALASALAAHWVWTSLFSPDYPPFAAHSTSLAPHSGDR